jgi:hypothetical protein
MATKIPNHLVRSILVTFCCCIPLGIPAIVYATQVNLRLQAGDIKGALEASRKAKLWSWWAFGVGLFFNALYFLTLAFENFLRIYRPKM